jgi:hypothetical protein
MIFLFRFIILSIIFTNSLSIFERNNYLKIRNFYLKKYYTINNPILKKTCNYLSSQLNNFYYKYLNTFYYLSFEYYTLTDDKLILLETASLLI